MSSKGVIEAQFISDLGLGLDNPKRIWGFVYGLWGNLYLFLFLFFFSPWEVGIRAATAAISAPPCV